MSKRTGVYCPACDRTGIDSEMIVQSGGFRGDGAMLKCTAAGHAFEYSKLMSLKPRMMRLAITEKQPANTTTLSVWVYPEVLQRLQERFPQNLNTTMCSLMTALADDDTLIIEGEHTRELREMTKDLGIQISKGRDIVGLAKTNVLLKQEVEAMRLQMKMLEPVMKLLGMAAAGSDEAAAGQANPLAALAALAQQPVATGATAEPLHQPPHQQFPQSVTFANEDSDFMDGSALAPVPAPEPGPAIPSQPRISQPRQFSQPSTSPTSNLSPVSHLARPQIPR